MGKFSALSRRVTGTGIKCLSLIRTSFLNFLAVSIKMLTLLGINKLLAVYVGPSGYAALGQLQSFVQITTAFASSAINTGVTKYTAEYHEDEVKQRAVWRTAALLAMVGSSAIAIMLWVFGTQLAKFLLKRDELEFVFTWFAASIILIVFNTLLASILNGRQDIRRYVAANIAGSVLSMVVTAGLVANYRLAGALVALVVHQAIAFFATLLICLHAQWFRRCLTFGAIDKGIVANLGKFAVMALTTAVTGPVCHMLIRDYLGATIGWNAAGYWEAMWRLSAAYSLFVTATLSVYFLPKLSQTFEPREMRREVVQGYKLLVPVAVGLAALVYSLKDLLIEALFTSEFAPMEVLFGWQVFGDVLRMCSWLVASIMLSKAMHGPYIVSEVSFAIIFYAMTYVLVPHFGLQGVALAHTLVYLGYWIFSLWAVRRYLGAFGANAA